jgi:hypothetical protein
MKRARALKKKQAQQMKMGRELEPDTNALIDII